MPGLYDGDMKLLLAILLLGCIFVLRAQESGTIPRWEVIEMAGALSAGSDDIVKILSQIRPKEWIQDGALQYSAVDRLRSPLGLGHVVYSGLSL